MSKPATNTSTSNAASYNQIGSGITALASGYASLQASSMQARQFKMEGVFLGLQREQEKLKGRENAIFLRQKFLNNIASSTASFAARGVSTGSGIGRQMAIQGLKTLGEDIKAVELNSEAAQIQLGLKQSQSKLNERITRNIGIMRAGNSFGSGSESLLTGFSTIKTGDKNGE
jgi:hypothetical protein